MPLAPGRHRSRHRRRYLRVGARRGRPRGATPRSSRVGRERSRAADWGRRAVAARARVPGRAKRRACMAGRRSAIGETRTEGAAQRLALRVSPPRGLAPRQSQFKRSGRGRPEHSFTKRVGTCVRCSRRRSASARARYAAAWGYAGSPLEEYPSGRHRAREVRPGDSPPRLDARAARSR